MMTLRKNSNVSKEVLAHVFGNGKKSFNLWSSKKERKEKLETFGLQTNTRNFLIIELHLLPPNILFNDT
jgi:hypothetical protein